jgi:hypothetical protein
MHVAESEDDGALRGADETRYVLLTECLQNDFLLNRECRLYLGDHAALAMLAGRNAQLPRPGGGRLPISSDDIARGPLGVFLEAVIDGRRRRVQGRGTLHVINIRDWHEPASAYDLERRAYGSHCERGTWGANYVDGFERLLDPVGGPCGDDARSYAEGSVRICHIHADSMFDFRPRVREGDGPMGKLPAAELEDIVDILVQGRDEDLAAVDQILRGGVWLDSIRELADRVDKQEPSRARVYMAVIGVYSDVKVLTLLGGLLARYDLPNLAVSDTLTSSPTLERHIAGLDFAAKVMHVEVVHGVNDLVRYLGGTPPLESETNIVSPDGFDRYQTFFKDKQSVLAYQTEKLQDYLALTEKRALDTYAWIKRSNLFLIAWGSAFLVATLVFAIWSAVDPDVSWALAAITGGVGLIQLVSAFYTQPMQYLNRNLTNLTTYRMVLESHSLKMALARFHLTTPHALREVRTDREGKEAKRQVELLERELTVIEKADAVDYLALRALGLGGEDEKKKEREEQPAVAGGDGSAVDGGPEHTPATATEQAGRAPPSDARGS